MSVTDVVQAFGWIPVCWLLAVHVLIRFGRLPRHGRAVRIAGVVAALTVVVVAVLAQLWPVAVLGLLFGRTDLLGHRHHDEREAHRIQDLLDRFHRHRHEPDAQPASEQQPESEQPGEPEQPGGAEQPPGRVGQERPAPRTPPLLPSARRSAADLIAPQFPAREVLPDMRIHHGPASPAAARASRSATATIRSRPRTKDDPDFVPAAVGLREAHHPDPQTRPQSRGMRAVGSAQRLANLALKLEIGAVVVVALVLFGIWSEGQREEFVRNSDQLICRISSSC